MPCTKRHQCREHGAGSRSVAEPTPSGANCVAASAKKKSQAKVGDEASRARLEQIQTQLEETVISVGWICLCSFCT